jgi:P27 family predicted phage terminase small subunit
MGRHSLSDMEKKLKGTLQKCRVNNSKPISKIKGSIQPSIELDETGVQIFERTKKFLIDNNMMGEVDVDALSSYCAEMSTYVELKNTMKQVAKLRDSEIERMTKEGMSEGDIAAYIETLPSPYQFIKLSHECLEKALKISDRFGFTPSSRQKLKAETKEEKIDPIVALMNPQFKTAEA